MIAINPQKIQGKWHAGIALDFHTLSSTPIGYDDYGHMQFDTKRPAIAELLYQLKYKGDRSAAQGIITAAATFLKPYRQKFDLIIPVPPVDSSPSATGNAAGTGHRGGSGFAGDRMRRYNAGTGSPQRDRGSRQTRRIAERALRRGHPAHGTKESAAVR